MNVGQKSRKGVWTEDQILTIKKIWGTVKDSEVARILDKTVSSVRLKATVLKLREEKGKRAGTRSGELTLPWSKTEKMTLIKNVGSSSVFELMEMLPNRTRASIESKCRQLQMAPTQGSYTRCGIERQTGYNWRQIKRARDALGQEWKRYGIRKYIISEDQFDDIIEWLKNEKRQWSRRWNLDVCRICGLGGETDDRRHSGDGLCKSDWDARRYVRNTAIAAINSGKLIKLTEDTWNSIVKGSK